MNQAAKIPWAHDIRKHVYQMLLLLAIFGLIAGGYYKWYEVSAGSLSTTAADYHLASKSHYLLAVEELRQEQFCLATTVADSSGSELLRVFGVTSWDVHNHDAVSYVIQREIGMGLDLHRRFSDARFDNLSLKLEQQLLSYERSITHWRSESRNLDQLTADLNDLLTTLHQLVSLHTIVHDSLMADLASLKNRQATAFSLLLVVLLGAGLFILGRSLRAISAIIEERKLAEERIRFQAHYDNLTGLPNRFLTLDRLSQLMKEAKRDSAQVAVMFLDLDDFKKVNDSLGHDTGDQLLVEAGARLQQAVRSVDTVGRLGGDEFILILGRVVGGADIQGVVESLFDQLRKPFKISNREMLITASVGIAVYPGDGNDASTLLRKADSAMYHSKQAGRNTYSFFTDSMNQQASRRLALEEQIHGALDRGEINVVYQPQFNVKDGSIMGAEALLRWNNPALGAVGPDEFIPIAEQTGLIVPIGQFVLNEALGNTACWCHETNADFRIAVNLSPRQFRDPQLVGYVASSLRKFGLSSHQLELEITEGVLMSGHGYIDEALAALSKLGVTLAMDDFGVGYSSLSYLRRYPFDVIKIDRSFVQGIETSTKDVELVNAAISMAHSMNLEVTAEGVDTEQQLEHLKRVACDYMQGYLLGKPMPAEDLARLLESGSGDPASNVVGIG